MKQLIKKSVFPIILLCSLYACSNEKTYTIFSKKYTDKECICKYSYQMPEKLDWIWFEDSCNKYEIRDTIK